MNYVSVSTSVQSPNATYSQLITYHGLAETLPKALKGIFDASTKTFHLKCGDSLRNEIIVVNVNNVPLKQLLEKIAKVEFAKLTFEGNTYYLNEDESAMQARDNKTYEAQAKFLAKSLAIHPENSSGSNSNAPAGQPIGNTFGKTSDDTKALLTLIGPNLIARLKPGERIVFSTESNSLQLPFPAGSSTYLETLSKQALGHALNTYDPDNNTNPVPVAKAPVAKIDLVIENGAGYNGTNTIDSLSADDASLIDFDAKGKILGEIPIGIPFISDYGPDVPPPAHSSSNQSGNSNDVTQGPMVLTGLANQIYLASFDLMGFLMNKSYGSTSEILPYALDPIKYEPLLVNGAFVSTMANAYKLNLVASLPDSFINNSFEISVRSKIAMTPQQALKHLKSLPDINVAESEGWLTVAPKLPTLCHEYRLDRQFLKDTLQYFHTTKELDASTLGQIAVGFHGIANQLALNSLMSVNLSLSNQVGDNCKWSLLYFYGLLSQDQRDTLNGGGTISESALSPDARAAAQFLVYGASQQLYTDQKPNDPSETSSIFDVGSNLQVAADYESEPTEVAPNGISSSSPIKGAALNLKVYRIQFGARAKKNTVSVMAKDSMTAEETGSYLYINERSELGNGPQGTSKIVGILQGTRSLLTVKIYITPAVFAGGTLFENVFGQNPTRFNLDNLPDDVKSAMQKLKKELQTETSGESTNSGSGP